MRLFASLLLYTLLALVGIVAVLTAAQASRLLDLVTAPGAPSGRVLGLGAVAMLEAALPIAGLVAAGLVHGRERAEGAALARQALGQSPGRVYGPAVALGVVLGAVAATLAVDAVPRALTQLRQALVESAIAAIEAPHPPIHLPDDLGSLWVNHGADGAEPAQHWWVVGDGVARPPTLVVFERVRAVIEPEGPTLLAGPTALWGPGLRARVGHARVSFADRRLGRRLAMLGPPNAVPSAGLPTREVHSRFVWHRRLSVPAMAPAWALLGALLGAAWGGARAVLGAATAVALGYWILRAGELAARGGALSPVVAAWAPVLLVSLVVLGLAPRLIRRAGAC